MKPIFSSVGIFTVALAIAALMGCAADQYAQHHPNAAASQATEAMSSGSGSADEKMNMMDMKAMCDMYQKMMSAKTPEERRAMMNERMKNMSPEMMQKHMDMMQAQCK